jgi:mycoredoxin-dependent peroxiredoxin
MCEISGRSVSAGSNSVLKSAYLLVLAALVVSLCPVSPAYAQSGSALSEAKQHYQNAITAIGTGDWQTAKNELLDAEQLAPRNALVHYDLALAYSHLGEIKSAQDELNEAAQLGLPAEQQQAAADLKQHLATQAASSPTRVPAQEESAMATTTLKVGEIAPDFTLLTDQSWGKAIRLSDYRGQKNVILAFYVLAFTGSDAKELQAYQANLAKLQTSDTEVFGISIDSPPVNAAFAKQIGVTFPLLSDMSREVLTGYGILKKYTTYVAGDEYEFARRTTFVIDKDGKIQHIEFDASAINPNNAVNLCVELHEQRLARNSATTEGTSQDQSQNSLATAQTQNTNTTDTNGYWYCWAQAMDKTPYTVYLTEVFPGATVQYPTNTRYGKAFREWVVQQYSFPANDVQTGCMGPLSPRDYAERVVRANYIAQQTSAPWTVTPHPIVQVNWSPPTP